MVQCVHAQYKSVCLFLLNIRPHRTIFTQTLLISFLLKYKHTHTHKINMNSNSKNNCSYI